MKTSIVDNSDNTNNEAAEINSCLHNSNVSFVVRATEVVQIKSNNKIVKCNALLNSCSQCNLITSSLVTRLHLSNTSTKMQLSGIKDKVESINNCTVVSIKSVYNNFETNLICFAIPKMTDNKPSETIDRSKISIPENLKLANPTFHRVSQIDLLIGAELFYNFIRFSSSKKTHLD